MTGTRPTKETGEAPANKPEITNRQIFQWEKVLVMVLGAAVIAAGTAFFNLRDHMLIMRHEVGTIKSQLSEIRSTTRDRFTGAQAAELRQQINEWRRDHEQRLRALEARPVITRHPSSGNIQ